MKYLPRIAVAAAFAFSLALPCYAQKRDEGWSLPNARVNPPQKPSADSLVWKPVKWSFPRSGLVTLDLDGRKVYQLAKSVFATKGELKNGTDTGIIIFSPEIAAGAELIHAQDPAQMPDVDKFLAAVAVSKAVESPQGYTEPYLGSGKLEGVRLYFFTTHSGANVGAAVSSDRRRVVIVPAPSEP